MTIQLKHGLSGMSHPISPHLNHNLAHNLTRFLSRLNHVIAARLEPIMIIIKSMIKFKTGESTGGFTNAFWLHRQQLPQPSRRVVRSL